MKIVIRTVFFHFSCIVGFGMLYFYLKDDFLENVEENEVEIIDYMMLSTNIQTGVGIYNLYPTTFYCKLAMIIQQILMICAHVFTIYVFTI